MIFSMKQSFEQIMERRQSLLSLTRQPPDIVPSGEQILKHRRTWALIHLPAHSGATHDLTRCNICPGVQSPREDISWTLIWDYSQKLQQDEQGLLSPPVTFIWQEHGMITPRVLSSFSPTVLHLCMWCWYAVGGFLKGGCYHDDDTSHSIKLKAAQ